ncbi:hypothetical protein [Zunongwangia pacifica]|uniref:Uncharacterized protein n=1 Tax=Zunongwangia pacifica TaxID=2911062 RepID=A0A9X1ZR05_9FLAO|nr:hypothetical protein [Zunongwangia pacifica]MCL6219417.1 hypothetical protein [Zunongwangia pacifica]
MPKNKVHFYQISTLLDLGINYTDLNEYFSAWTNEKADKTKLSALT